jgi:hypothetical protein
MLSHRKRALQALRREKSVVPSHDSGGICEAQGLIQGESTELSGPTVRTARRFTGEQVQVNLWLSRGPSG